MNFRSWFSRSYSWLFPAPTPAPTPAPVPPPVVVAPAPAPAPAPVPVPAPPPVVVAPTPAPTPIVTLACGSNLTGGDNTYSDWQGGAGPVSGTHYLFVTTADVDYLVSKGCTTFRLLFGWESMQPTSNATIPGKGNYGTYYSKFKAIVDYATSKGCTVIIDIHGGADSTFAAYYGNKVGSTYQGVAVSALLANLWTQLATIFKGNGRVWFGITNEPNIAASVWYPCAQALINAIRGTGALNAIIMPGVNYTSAATWSTDNDQWKTLKDPASNLVMQVHMYFDSGGGGSGTDIVSDTIGVQRLTNAVTWARAHGAKLFLAEVALQGGSTLATNAWQHLLAFMQSNEDVIIGWTWWAYGPASWWGGYQFTLDQKSGKDSAQMTLLTSSGALVG